MSRATDRNTAVELRAVLSDGLELDMLVPGTIVFLRPQTGDRDIRYNGALVPVASVSDEEGATPFGLINRSQASTPQSFAAFGISTLLVNIAGEAETIVADPGPTAAAITVTSSTSGKTYNLGRRMGSWFFPGPNFETRTEATGGGAAILSPDANPRVGTACAIVAMNPCIA